MATSELHCMKCYGTDLRMDGTGSETRYDPARGNERIDLPTASYTCLTCGAGLRVQMTRDASDAWYEEVNRKARALMVRKKDRMPGRYRG